MGRHAKLPVLKAVAVTIPFVRAIESRLRPGTSTALALRKLVDFSIDLAESHEGGIGDFVNAAKNTVEANLHSLTSLNDHESGQIKLLLEDWAYRAECDAKGEPYTKSADASRIGNAVLACIAELTDIFNFAEGLAGDYLASESLALPEISYSTSFAPEIGGSCQRDDNGATLRNIVVLVLPERGFSNDSLYAAPYIVVHELLCHAAQAISGPLPRSASGSNCAWSDGWMDCFASEATLSWLLKNALGVPDWISDAANLISTHVTDAHAARYDPARTSIPNKHYLIFNEAREAWFGVKQAYREFGFEEWEVDDALTAFSLQYNALNIPFTDRQDLVVGMWMKSHTAADRRLLASATTAFIENANAIQLQKTLGL